MFILALVFNELYKQVIKASNNMALKLIAFKIDEDISFYEYINSLGAHASTTGMLIVITRDSVISV